MNDTPETNKEWDNWLNKLKIPIESFVDFARKLERERDQWRKCAERLANAFQDVPHDPFTIGWSNAENCEIALAEFERLKEASK